MSGALASVPVRVRHRHSDDSLAIKLRVSHLVGSVDFEPAGMAPAATLIVRRMRDPMPRALRSDAHAIMPSRQWEHAARLRISEIARTAARPSYGAIPSAANAVLFADEAELLACFTRDLLSGAAHSRWWWRALLRTLPGSAIANLMEAWRRNIKFVPAALTLLASTGEAVPALRSISDGDAWAILADIARAFDLEFVSRAEQSWEVSLARRGVTEKRESKKQIADVIADMHHGWPLPTIAKPWRELLADSEVPEEIGPEGSALLAVALLLGRKPRAVRTREFCGSFVSWWRATRLHKPVGYPASRSSAIMQNGWPSLQQWGLSSEAARDAQEPESTRAITADSGRDLEPFTLENSSQSIGTSKSQQPFEIEEKSQSVNDLRAGMDDEKQKLSGAKSSTPPKGESLVSGFEAVTGAAEDKFIANAVPEAALNLASIPETLGPRASVQRLREASEPIPTQLGGVLFLINLLTALRLPQSLEAESGCQFELSSWELLELIARCLLSRRHAHLLDDPIWSVLALVDGRSEEQLAGACFATASFYRSPGSWIPNGDEGGAPNQFGIRLRHHTLEIWNPLGFVHLKQNFAQSPSRVQIVNEIAGLSLGKKFSIYRPSLRDRGAHPLGLRIGGALQQFLSFLMPFIRRRLADGLGIPGFQHADLASLVLLRPGHIWMTPTHVDLKMDLAQAASIVRRAGFDADPGWVPALGRVIKFHFE